MQNIFALMILCAGSDTGTEGTMPGASSGDRPLWQRYAVKSDYRKHCEYLRNTDPGSCDHGCGNCDRNFMRLERRKTEAVLMRISDLFLAFPGLVFALAVAAVLGGESRMRSSPWL